MHAQQSASRILGQRQDCYTSKLREQLDTFHDSKLHASFNRPSTTLKHSREPSLNAIQTPSLVERQHPQPNHNRSTRLSTSVVDQFKNELGARNVEPFII